MAKRTATKGVQFPGIPTTADGSEAVVWVEIHTSQGACAYPITPSTNMGGAYQMAVANAFSMESITSGIDMPLK